MISVLYRTVSMKKSPPHAQNMGRAGTLAVPPNFGALRPLKAFNAATRCSLLSFQPHRSKENFTYTQCRCVFSRRRTLSAHEKQATFLFHRVSLFGVVCILATQHCYFSIEIFGFQAFHGILWTEFCGYRTVFVIFDKNSQITQLNFRVGYGTMTILNYGNGR